MECLPTAVDTEHHIFYTAHPGLAKYNLRPYKAAAGKKRRQKEPGKAYETAVSAQCA
jgi:hypothetical protein